ncbi:MAG: M1 family metallopeptidase [Chitinophagaceae bacterium]
MDLSVAFDWEKHTCTGKQVLLMKPYFYSQDTIVLDAKEMTFDRVEVFDENNRPFLHIVDYNKKSLKIIVERKILPNEIVKVKLSYIAAPDLNESVQDKSISNNKGLYFINTDHLEPFQPTQIWTQGETQSNSCWFPTLDHPSQKFTSTLKITAPQELTIVSNGIRTHTEIDQNMRIETWENKNPMSAYLIMIAIGHFAETTFSDAIVPMQFYTDPAYAPYANRMFAKTDEMIAFYSEKLGVAFPWDKYAQLIVHDYVSGAMENTSASIFGDFCQKTNRELIDKDNEEIIAHELFHQWFGDLVTCSDWSHLVLNEGLASFGEYLWYEHAYGKDRAMQDAYYSLQRYIEYAKTHNDHSIIQYDYKDRDDMFNNITYQKGARVMQLLKKEVGEEAFFISLQKYLTTYQFGNADLDQFRTKFEETSGKNLKPFFTQWFYEEGHPAIDISYYYSDSLKRMEVQVLQQNANSKLFSTQLDFKVWQGNDVMLYTFPIHKRKEVFYVEKKNNYVGPPVIIPDPNGEFVGEIIEHQSLYAQLTALKKASNYIEKIRAIKSLAPQIWTSQEIRDEYIKLFHDKNDDIRLQSIHHIKWSDSSKIAFFATQLEDMASHDENSLVRAKALACLGLSHNEKYKMLYQQKLNDSSYQVASDALQALYYISKQEALNWAEENLNESKGSLQEKIIDIFVASSDKKYLPYFDTLYPKLFNNNRAHLVQQYSNLLRKINLDTEYQNALPNLHVHAIKDKYASVRKASLKAIWDIKEEYTKALNNSKIKENKELLMLQKTPFENSIEAIIKSNPIEFSIPNLLLLGITRN